MDSSGKEKKKKRRADRPKKESLIVKRERVFFFSHILYAVELIKGEYRRYEGSAWNSAAEADIIHLSAKVGKVSRGWKGRRRKTREMVGCGALRPSRAHKETDWSRKRSSPLAFAVAARNILDQTSSFPPQWSRKVGWTRRKRGERKKLDKSEKMNKFRFINFVFLKFSRMKT